MLLWLLAYVKGLLPRTSMRCCDVFVLLYVHTYRVQCWEIILFWWASGDVPVLVCLLGESRLEPQLCPCGLRMAEHQFQDSLFSEVLRSGPQQLIAVVFP